MNTRAFQDYTCPKCRRSFGCCGELTDTVTCTHCKTTHDVSHDRKVIDKLRAKMLDDQHAEWDARTPEQEAAYLEGQTAYDPKAGTVFAGRSPHLDRSTRPTTIGPLHRWWMWGWHAREFGTPVGRDPFFGEEAI